MGPQPKVAPEELDDETAPAFDGVPPSIDELIAKEDAPGLYALGTAYRLGAAPLARDAFKALECFQGASRFGHAEAEFMAGLAYMDGRGVEPDQVEGAKRMRAAAQRGSLRAKVYVANLYEMGVIYQTDREKADVWYRNVARAAGIAAEPGTPEHDLAMAELGCVRHCLAIVADDALSPKDRATYLKKAKSMGYEHRLAATKRERTPSEQPAVDAKPSSEPAPEQQKPPEPKPKQEAKKAPEESLLGAQWTWGPGLVAFIAATFFVATSSFAGWLAMEGSRALAHAHHPLPLVGSFHQAVLYAVVLALGIMPATTAYRGRVVAIATAIGLAAGAAGHFAWASVHLLWHPLAQTFALGLGAFLLALLVLGVLGGTRARIKKATRIGKRGVDQGEPQP
jgi:hypothetical protein